MENRLLKTQDVSPHASDRFEISRIGRQAGFAQLVRRNAELTGREGHTVDSPGVVDHRAGAAGGNIRADPLDDLLRRKRLAERRDRAHAPPE